jgi:hypothetical protein
VHTGSNLYLQRRRTACWLSSGFNPATPAPFIQGKVGGAGFGGGGWFCRKACPEGGEGGWAGGVFQAATAPHLGAGAGSTPPASGDTSLLFSSRDFGDIICRLL